MKKKKDILNPNFTLRIFPFKVIPPKCVTVTLTLCSHSTPFYLILYAYLLFRVIKQRAPSNEQTWTFRWGKLRQEHQDHCSKWGARLFLRGARCLRKGSRQRKALSDHDWGQRRPMVCSDHRLTVRLTANELGMNRDIVGKIFAGDLKVRDGGVEEEDSGRKREEWGGELDSGGGRGDSYNRNSIEE